MLGNRMHGAPSVIHTIGEVLQNQRHLHRLSPTLPLTVHFVLWRTRWTVLICANNLCIIMFYILFFEERGQICCKDSALGPVIPDSVLLYPNSGRAEPHNAGPARLDPSYLNPSYYIQTAAGLSPTMLAQSAWTRHTWIRLIISKQR